MTRGATREAECPRCGRTVRVHVPRHGDGTEWWTYWHKHAGDRTRWCRAFMDLLDTRPVSQGGS